MRILSLLLCLLGISALVCAEQNPPWGVARVLDIQYPPGKVLVDVTTGDPQKLARVLDRINYLNNLYDAEPFESSIVAIIHGDAIPFFVHENYPSYRELMKRAQSLTVGTSVEFRMCQAAARLLNYRPDDVHGFVAMVPMADAEIVRLQQEEGYAYLR